MSGVAGLPPTDFRLLIAFFGGCLVVFVLGRVLGKMAFGMDGVAQSILGIGGVFSNNVLVGVPVAKVALGVASIPAVSMVLVFNALLLWTLITVSVEWARYGTPSLAGLAKTAGGVLANPIVASILAGALWSFTGLTLPGAIDKLLEWLGQIAVPLSLVALGMGLAEYGLRNEWREGLAMTALKLVAQPLVVFLIAWAMGLPVLETQVVVLLACLPLGVNVYLMARQFRVLQGAVASCLVLSTALAAISTPLVLAMLGAGS
jgi:malonate transporter